MPPLPVAVPPAVPVLPPEPAPPDWPAEPEAPAVPVLEFESLEHLGPIPSPIANVIAAPTTACFALIADLLDRVATRANVNTFRDPGRNLRPSIHLRDCNVRYSYQRRSSQFES